MGLTFHYNGRIKDLASIPAFTKEVTDICETMNWEYEAFDVNWEIPDGKEALLELEEKFILLKGVIFCPHPKSESIYLTFAQNGRLFMPFNINMLDVFSTPDLLYSAFTKTQFAGPDTHIASIKLLKYLNSKYFSEFNVEDEGYYWKTDDEDLLRQRFDQYNFLLDKVTSALTNFKGPAAASPTGLIEQIENIIKGLSGEEGAAD